MSQAGAARGRRAFAIAVIATVAFGVTTSRAFAGGDLWQIATASGDSFDFGAIDTVDQGARGEYQNANIFTAHNVTADENGPDGKPFFRTGTFVGDDTREIEGVPYLTVGEYPFTCTLHPENMFGTLTVNEEGTPVPRPALDLKIKSKKLAKVAKRKTLKVTVAAGASEAEGVVLEAKKGKKAISKPLELELGAGDSERAKLKLKNAAARKLAKLDKANLKVTGSVDFGSPAKTAKKLK